MRSLLHYLGTQDDGVFAIHTTIGRRLESMTVVVRIRQAETQSREPETRNASQCNKLLLTTFITPSNHILSDPRAFKNVYSSLAV